MKDDIEKPLEKYILYDYDMIEVIEQSVRASITKIANIKQNFVQNDFSEKEDPLQKGFNLASNFFTKTLALSNKQKPKEIKFEMISRIPTNLMAQVDKMINRTPFENFLLYSNEETESSITNKAIYKEEEDNRLINDMEENSIDHILYFTDMINQVSGKFESQQLRINKN